MPSWLGSLLICNPIIVVQGGFEPPQTEPKPVVLPLHHWTLLQRILKTGAKVVVFHPTTKFLANYFTISR